VRKDSAYILFYIRTDVQEKQLKDVFPSLKEFFPGKPVKAAVGEGYVVGKGEQGKVEIKVKKNPDKYLV